MVYGIELNKVTTVITNTKNSDSSRIDGRIEFSGKSVKFYVSEKNPLLPQTTYQLSIKLKNRLSFGQKEFTLNFKTEKQSDSSLPNNQQDKAIENVDALNDGRVVGLEFAKYLPYNTDSFYIIHNVLEDNTVEFVAYLKGDQEKAKQDVLEWIKSKGADPNKLNLRYEENQYF